MPSVKKTDMRTVVIRPEKKAGKGSLLILILILAMAFSAAYLAIKGAMTKTPPSDSQQPTQQAPQQVSGNQVSDGSVLDKVKRHLYVQSGDQPRYIGTISDISLLKSKNPDFYANADEGDRVLIWNDRAVIYSEKKDLIISVATAKPLLQDDTTQAPTSSSTAPTSIDAPSSADLATQLASTTVEIRNGTRVTGAASRLKLQLSQQAVNVIKVGDGVQRQGTLVVDLTSGTSSGVVDLLLQATSGTRSNELPPGEPPTAAGIVVIIGK